MRVLTGWTTGLCFATAVLVLLAAMGSAASGVCVEPPGDINGDGATTISDVQCEILYSLAQIGGTATDVPACVDGPPGIADVTCDGSVDVSDIITVISLVLGQEFPPETDLDGDQCPDACEDVACTDSTGAPAVDCDDGDASTFDTCIEGPGCVHVAAGSSCRPDQAGACGGQGSCERTAGSLHFICDCPPGWTGLQCDACADGWHPVSTDGTAGVASSATAFDLAGATDTQSPTPIACEPDESCGGQTCGGHGECDDSTGRALCQCALGYLGTYCERCDAGFDANGDGDCVRGQTCRVAECGNRGDCVDIDDVQHCLCDAGFAGARCGLCDDGFHDNGTGCVPDETCEASTCSNGGLCTVADGEVTCACPSGFGGPDCSESCAGETCGGNGTCVLGADGAACICSNPDLDPEQSCEACGSGLALAVDATGAPSCILSPPCPASDCNGHGACGVDPTNGAAGCVCDNGWTGPACGRCPTGQFGVDEVCMTASQCRASLCSDRGDCTGSATSPACACMAGAIGDDCSDDLPISAYRIEGAFEVLEAGEQAVIKAEVIGVGDHGPLQFEVADGGGFITQTSPTEAIYTAPSAPPIGLEVATIKVGPKCCPSSSIPIGITVKAPSLPFVTGKAVPNLAPVDSRLMNFMYDRCTGGAVLGLNWNGIPILRRGYGRDEGRSTPGRPGVSCGPAVAGAQPVWPDSPVRIGSNTKAIAAAIVRKSVELRLLITGRLPDEDDFGSTAAWRQAVDQAVEDARILDADLNLLPITFRQRAGSCTWTGASPTDTTSYSCTDGPFSAPVTINVTDNTAPASCGGTVCFNGGSCQLDGGGNAICNCPTGYSGSRCRLLTGGPDLASNGVDRRWQDITVGMLFTHESGLPNGVVSNATVLANLEALRQVHQPGWDIPNDLGPELHEYSAAFAPPGAGESPRYYLEDRPSTFEYILAQLGRNLDYDPGQRSVYSNLGFVVLTAIGEWTAANPQFGFGEVWSGAVDHHTDHLSGRLDGWVRVWLGGYPGDDNPYGAGRSRYGMFLARTPDPSDAPDAQLDPFELEPREWISGSWNPDRDDRKGNVCRFENGQCTWESGVIDYFGNPGQTKFGYHGTLMFAGAGGVVTESETYLRFMKKFTVGYTSSFPGYGRPRTGFSRASSHNGEWVGARSHVRQIGWQTTGSPGTCTAKKVACNPGDELPGCCPAGETCCGGSFDCVASGWVSGPIDGLAPSNNECVRMTTYKIPNITQSTGDYIDTDANPAADGGCVLPEGLDIFVSTNQSSDSEDIDGDDYDFLSDAVLRGLCQVIWPPNPYVLGPNGNQVQAQLP